MKCEGVLLRVILEFYKVLHDAIGIGLFMVKNHPSKQEGEW